MLSTVTIILKLCKKVVVCIKNKIETVNFYKVLYFIYLSSLHGTKGKKGGKNWESIQSSTTGPVRGYHMGK